MLRSQVRMWPTTPGSFEGTAHIWRDPSGSQTSRSPPAGTMAGAGVCSQGTVACSFTAVMVSRAFCTISTDLSLNFYLLGFCFVFIKRFNYTLCSMSNCTLLISVVCTSSPHKGFFQQWIRQEKNCHIKPDFLIMYFWEQPSSRNRRELVTGLPFSLSNVLPV